MPRAFMQRLFSFCLMHYSPSISLPLVICYISGLPVPSQSFLFLPLCLLYTVQYSFAFASASAIILTSYYLLIINSSGRIVTESDSACSATDVGRLFLGVVVGEESDRVKWISVIIVIIIITSHTKQTNYFPTGWEVKLRAGPLFRVPFMSEYLKMVAQTLPLGLSFMLGTLHSGPYLTSLSTGKYFKHQRAGYSCLHC
jgi:hypothetical protein